MEKDMSLCFGLHHASTDPMGGKVLTVIFDNGNEAWGMIKEDVYDYPEIFKTLRVPEGDVKRITLNREDSRAVWATLKEEGFEECDAPQPTKKDKLDLQRLNNWNVVSQYVGDILSKDYAMKTFLKASDEDIQYYNNLLNNLLNEEK